MKSLSNARCLPILLGFFLHGAAAAWTVSGRITEPGGAGIAGVDLDFEDQSTGDIIFTPNDDTDLNGDYSTTVPTGDYRIFFNSPPGYFSDKTDVTISSNQVIDWTLPQGVYVSGYVKDLGGAGLANVDLNFYGPSGQNMGYAGDNTDAAGFYQVLVDPNMTFDILYRPSPGDPHVAFESKGQAVGGSDLSLPDVVLDPGFFVTGLVMRKGTNNPVVGADIDAVNAATGEKISRLGFDNTDGTGAWQVVLKPGAWDLIAWPPAGQGLAADIMPGVVVSGNMNAGTFELPVGFTVGGTVQGPGAAPLSGVNVDPIDAARNVEMPTPGDHTDGSGLYAMILGASTYHLIYWPPAGQPLAAAVLKNRLITGATTLPTVQLQGGVVISGTVRTLSGLPVWNADINVEESPGTFVYPTADDNSGSDGAYFIRVPAGSYRFIARPPAESGLEPDTVTATVSANQVIDFALGSGGTTGVAEPTGSRLSGRVVDPAGQPVFQVDLDFYIPGTRTKVDPSAPGAPAQTDKTSLQGEYTLLVKPDRYDIRYQPPAGRIDLATVLLEGVTVQNDTLIDVRLPLGYPLSGRVTGPSGTPVPNVDIDVTDPVTGRRAPTPGDNTGASGAYRVVIVPGRYTVSFTPPSGVRLAARVMMDVEVAAATRLDVSLEAGHLLTGRVEDPDGSPVPLADVDVDDALTGERIHTADDRTTPEGRFAVIVPAGRFDVTVNPPPGLALASAVRRGVDVSGDVEAPAVRLVPGVAVRALILGPGREPLPGAKALFFEKDSGLRYPAPAAVSGGNGIFTARIPGGEYFIRVAAPRNLGLDTLEVGLLMLRDDTSVIWDFAAPPVLSLTVRLQTPDPAPAGLIRIWTSPRQGPPLAEATAGASGETSLHLPAGTYDLLVSASPGWRPDSVFVPGLELQADTLMTFAFEPESPPPGPVMVRAGRPYPNPFRGATVFSFSAPSGPARLRVFTADGRLIAGGLLEVSAGQGTWTWNGLDARGRSVSAGIYFLTVESGGRFDTARVVKIQ